MNQISRFQSMLTELNTIACKAGQTIMKYYEMERVKSKIKGDGTPVTEADIESERMVVSSLKSVFPHIPIISEEQTDLQLREKVLCDGNDTKIRRFWLVDPLDGTEAFMRKEEQFTINIGLVQNSKPVLGVIYFPVRDILYSGISGLQAQLRLNASRVVQYKPVQTTISSRSKDDPLIALVDSRISDFSSASKLDILLRKVKISKRIVDSNIHRLCGVVSGEIDISTIARSFEWDTAAGHAILKGAGGNIIDTNGTELQYGKPEFKNSSLIAHGRIFEY
jgi:3'(2'), 5'-bisphosphate nucleotidase